MNYLPFAVLAYLLNSIAVTVDKFLLTRVIPDPLIYIFYFSLVNLLAVLFIPFVALPGYFVLVFASISACLWTLAAYFMLKALKAGQVQRVIPVIGTLTSLVLLGLGAQDKSINTYQAFAIILLITGLIFLTITSWKGKLGKTEVALEAGSGLLFALSYYFLRLAFEKGDFLTVLVWSRPVLFPLVLMFLMIPNLRRKIAPYFHPKIGLVNPSSLLFIFGQTAAAISELLLNFAISLTSPAIVNSLQGIKYIFLLIFALLLGSKFPTIFKINFSKKFLLSQTAGVSFITSGLYLLATG